MTYSGQRAFGQSATGYCTVVLSPLVSRLHYRPCLWLHRRSCLAGPMPSAEARGPRCRWSPIAPSAVRYLSPSAAPHPERIRLEASGLGLRAERPVFVYVYALRYMPARPRTLHLPVWSLALAFAVVHPAATCPSPARTHSFVSIYN